MSVLKSVGVFLLLFVVCALAYWEISTLQEALKWDMLDCYFPWKFFAAESIQNRVFPLWNSYQHLGYPIYADMRSVFYPEGFLVGLLGGYNMQIMNFLFVFYITLAGLGFYKLTGSFVKNEFAKIGVALAYILCGFFVGHGQEMFGIIAATWIPWALHYFIQFQRNLVWSNLWKLALFLFLLLTGGYQALSLILLYLLVALFVIGTIKNRSFQSIQLVFKKNLALGVIVLFSVAVLIVTYVQVSSHVDRLTGLSLNDAYLGSLTPQALLSLFASFSVAGNADFLGTNISMANVYVGIVVLVLSIKGLFTTKKWEANVLWVFGTICLLASLGPHTPIREFLFEYVPAMNLFRMSSFFSYFSQISFLVLACIALERILEKPRSELKGIAISSWLVIIILVVILVSTLVDKQTEISEIFSTGFDFAALTYHQRLFLHASFQILVVLSFISTFRFAISRRNVLSFTVLALIIAEMFVSVRLNFQATVGSGFNPLKIQAQLDKEPQGFPIPPLSVPVGQNIESKPELNPLFHNTNIYSKTISADGFNSFRLDRFETYKDNHTKTFFEGLKKPLLFSNSAQSEIDITSFVPDKTECRISATENCLLVFQQTYFPGWKVEVDGLEQEQLLYNGIFPSARISEGEHSVVFKYENTPVLVGFGISYFILLIIIGCCLFVVFRSSANASKSQALVFTTAFMLIGVGLLGFKWAKTESFDKQRFNSYQALANELKNHLQKPETSLYLNVDLPSLFNGVLVEKNIGNKTNFLYGLECDDYSLLSEKLRKVESNKLVYAGSNLKEDRLVMELIQQHFPTKTSHRLGREYIHVFEKKGQRETIYQTSNGFESANPDWYYQESQKDTSAIANMSKFGWSISTTQMGSPPVVLRVGDITREPRLKFVFQTKALIPQGERNNAGMFIHIERHGKQYWHRAKNINSCAVEDGKWFETALVAEPEFDILPDDVLKVFVWGSDKGEPIYLDNMSFSIYPQD